MRNSILAVAVLSSLAFAEPEIEVNGTGVYCNNSNTKIEVLGTNILFRASGASHPFRIINSGNAYNDPAFLTTTSNWGLVGTSSQPIYEVYAGSVHETSDERVKEDIRDLEGDEVLRKLKNVRTVSYKRKEMNGRKDDARQIGFLAQDIQAVFPELVSHDKKKDTYAVKYTRAIPLLLRAIQ